MPGPASPAAAVDPTGLLRRKPGVQRHFDLAECDSDKETGFRPSAERFNVGEYVPLCSACVMQTQQLAVVENREMKPARR
jgi:hypothetical protein